MTFIRDNGPWLSLGDQAYWGGGYDTLTPDSTDVVSRVTISTTANSTAYGTLTEHRAFVSAAANDVRTIWAAGAQSGGTAKATLDYQDPVAGNTVAAFGDLSVAQEAASGVASPTIALWVSGNGGGANDIEVSAFASKGNAGMWSDLSGTAGHDHASAGNETHALTAGDTIASSDISVVAFAVPDGSRRQFGSLSVGRTRLAAVSTATRCFWAGGTTGPNVNTIDQVVIATEATATDVGDLTRTHRGVDASSNAVRAVVGGGYTGSAYVDTIDYFAVSGSTNDAVDFGDLTQVQGYTGAASNCHGGLQ